MTIDSIGDWGGDCEGSESDPVFDGIVDGTGEDYDQDIPFTSLTESQGEPDEVECKDDLPGPHAVDEYIGTMRDFASGYMPTITPECGLHQVRERLFRFLDESDYPQN